ncbi:MAG: Repressor in ring oxydation complex/phenylacetic acid degradation pathway related protein (PaaX) [Parcubacteria group bacterium Licking1014_1]|nr:MAG: Repressor in ring oxydation complex/phenylacetic acid degradation pathway related protein (PaaX) [Parcubacteria group bacterium Licking1014_1]
MKGKYSIITKEIIFMLALAGIIVVASTSPYFLINIARAIIKNKKYSKNKNNEQKIVRSLRKLRDSHIVIIKEKSDGKFMVELTERGRKKVEEIQFENMEIKRPKVWDGKWRIIAFDIPEKQKKRARDALREKLQKLNFYQMQKSVWVCPYPCEKEIQFLCELFNINPFVNIITANKIQDDIKLKKHFKL